MKGRAVGYVDGPFCEFRESSGSAYAFRGIAFDMIPAPFFLAIANNAQTVIILRMILHKNSVFQKGSCLAERGISQQAKQNFVDVIIPVVKPKFTLFQVKVKRVLL